MTGPGERVALTHLQIPLKEPLRPGDVEHSLRDAILVTVETGGGVGLGECAPIAPFAGAPGDMLERCWDDLAGRIAPSLLGRSFTTVEEVAGLADSWVGAR